MGLLDTLMTYTGPSKSNRPPLSPPMLTYSCLLINRSILYFRFIRNFKVPLLLNRQLCVNMGEDRGGLLLLDDTV